MGALFKLVGLVVVVVVVAGVALVGLAFLGSPSPTCGDGAVATSKAAADSFNTKWDAFDAVVKAGGPFTGTHFVVSAKGGNASSVVGSEACWV